MSADEQRQHARRARCAVCRVVRGTPSGTIAAKISGDTDESGPSTRTRDGPKTA